MTPVFQTQFVATHGKGNCMQAAIASLLELPLDDVPAFRDMPAGEWEDAFDQFLQQRGLFRIFIQFTSGFEQGDAFINALAWNPIGECRLTAMPALVFGKSPRGNTGHAILANIRGAAFELVHDPHPDGTGILGYPQSIHFIVPLKKS